MEGQRAAQIKCGMLTDRREVTTELPEQYSAA